MTYLPYLPNATCGAFTTCGSIFRNWKRRPSRCRLVFLFKRADNVTECCKRLRGTAEQYNEFPCVWLSTTWFLRRTKNCIKVVFTRFLWRENYKYPDSFYLFVKRVAHRGGSGHRPGRNSKYLRKKSNKKRYTTNIEYVGDL